MHRRLFSIGLALLALTVLTAVVVTRGPASAGAQVSQTYVPSSLSTPSPSFSTVWMSVVTVNREGRHVDVGAQSIVTDEAGDTRITQTWEATGSTSEIGVYDAGAHTWTRAMDYGRGGVSYFRGLEQAPAPLFDSAGAAATVVRAALAEQDPKLTVKATTFLGRPAWTASYTRGGWRTSSVVDQATGLPLRYAFVSMRHPRTQGSVWRAVDLRTHAPVDEDTFRLDIPAGAQVEESTAYEHFAPVGELAAKVDYEPLVPSVLPEGSGLLAASTQPDPWGPYAWLFPVPVPWVDLSRLPDRTTSLYYHRRFDRFTVHEWPLPGGIRNSTPAGLDKRPPDFYRKTALTTGAFAGCVARTWFNGNGSNGVGLYVQKRSMAVLVTGDLSRSDALALAASLQ